MQYIAYQNDPALKQAALERAASPDSAGWAVEDTDAQRAECAARFGLSESLLNLMAHGFHVPYGNDARGKLATALEAIEPGADTLALVRAWVQDLWETQVRPRVAGTAVQAHAEAMMELVRCTASGQVPREALRHARRAVAASAGTDPDLDPVLDLLTAMGWDLAVSPRATTDIWNLWEAMVMGPLNRAAGWEQPAQDAATQAVRDAYIKAREKLGAAPAVEGESPQESAARMQRQVNAELEAVGMLQRFEQFQAYAASTLVPAMTAWRQLADESIYRACRNARAGQA